MAWRASCCSRARCFAVSLFITPYSSATCNSGKTFQGFSRVTLASSKNTYRACVHTHTHLRACRGFKLLSSPGCGPHPARSPPVYTRRGVLRRAPGPQRPHRLPELQPRPRGSLQAPCHPTISVTRCALAPVTRPPTRSDRLKEPADPGRFALGAVGDQKGGRRPAASWSSLDAASRMRLCSQIS